MSSRTRIPITALILLAKMLKLGIQKERGNIHYNVST
jgi:hypothetical protein